MPKQLTALKVLIKNGRTLQYPNFDSLQAVKDFGGSWSEYVDTEGSGWLYDNLATAFDDDGEAPEGYISGLILVPDEFAKEAASEFPTLVSILSDEEAEAYYNNRHAIDFPDEEIDLEELQKIKLKVDLNIPLTAQQQKAIDPEDKTKGIRPNPKKTLTAYKQMRGII